MLLGRKHKERVCFGREVEEFGETGVQEEIGVLVHFEQVILLFIDKRHVFEFIIAHNALISGISHIRSSLGQVLSNKIITNKLFSPINNALNHM